MHQAKLTTLLTVLLATGGLLVGAAGAATLTVDGDGSAMYSTIQDAIDAAADGDVIEVAAGTYAETLQIDVAITLNGPNAGISPNTGVRGPEAVIDPASGRGINVDNTNGIVVIDGLTINDTTDAAFWLVQRTGFAADVTIRNMVVSNVTYGVICADQGNSPFQPHANLTISDNLFENTLGANISALWLKSVTGALTVSDNVIDNTGYGGILLVDDFTGTAVIEDNTISNTPQQGIQLAGVVNDAEVRNNTITSTNTIEDGDKGGIRIYGPEFTGTVNIHGNAISGSYNGIAVKDGMDLAGKDINIYDNDLAANSNLGLYHGGTGVLNAELNWWGDATGPQVAVTNPGGLGAGIGGTGAADVDYDPWWADMAMTITGSNETVQNVTQGTTHSTIQAAIDAASSGDIIEVGPRTYAESVNIGTSVTLASTDGAAATIIDGIGATVIDITADNVTIDGFTITNPDGKRGVTAQNRNGVTFTNNVVTAIGTADATTSGTNYGIAIVSGSAPVTNVDILNNTFSDIVGGDFKSVDAIAVGWSNGDHDITDIVIENNTIDNITTATVDYSSGGRGAYGVLVNHANPANAGRTVDLVVRNNTITNLEGLWVHGIGLEGDTPNALIEGNVLDTFIDHKDPSDAIGVFFEDNSYVATTTITHNSFTDISWGIAQHPTTATGAVAAPLNWYGAADPAAVAAQVFGDGIDYSPWLASGVDADGGTPGFQGDLSNLWVGAGGSIQEAIDAVVGSTVNVAAGTYDENLIFTKDVEINGPNAALSPNTDTRLPEAILMPSSGAAITGNADDIDVVVNGLTVDMGNAAEGDRFMNQTSKTGTTWTFEHNVFQNAPGSSSGHWLLNGANVGLVFTLTDNLFTGNDVSNGLAIWDADGFTIDVQDNVWEDNEYTAMNLNRAQGVIKNNIFRDTRTIDLDDPNYQWSNFQSGMILANENFDLEISGNVFSNVQYGVTMYANVDGPIAIVDNLFEDVTIAAVRASDSQAVPGDLDDVTVTGNAFVDYVGTGFAVWNARSDEAPLDATGNWWGDASGPYNATSNPAGTGVPVSDFVLFEPYLNGAIISSPDPLDLTAAAPTGTTTVSYLGGHGPCYGYSVTVLFDEALATASISKPASGPFSGVQTFQVLPITGGYRVDAALGGVQPGVPSADLFEIEFTAAGGSGQEVLDFTDVEIADFESAPVTDVPADDGLVRVDTGLPVIASALITDTTIGSTDWVKDGDDITVTATITDGSALASVSCDLTAFGGGGAVAPDGPPAADVYTWTLTGVDTTPADGPVSATITAVDDLGNTATATDQITADNTAPAALTGVAALPSHEVDGSDHYNQILVSWDDPASLDANVAGVEFRYTVNADYPDYAGGEPAAPADHTAGAEAFQATTGTSAAWYQLPDTSALARGIYTLAGFVYDQAGNYGPAEAVSGGNTDVATSYYLGDVIVQTTPGEYDGEVTIFDITTLANSYGKLQGEGGFNDETDVGPTDDFTRFGIPEPDGEVGFQDLMIFAMNFGEVAPTAKSDGAIGTPVFAFHRTDEDTWTLRLAEPCPGLKGLNLTADLPSGISVTVNPGELVAEQDAQVFLRNIDRNGLDAGLAIMGFGVGITGAGDLVTIKTSQPVEDLELEITARDLNNEELLVEMQQATGVEIPTVHSLGQNYPNPFNPQTTIKYALPTAADVQLKVYGVDGRLVKTLVNETREAGHHEVIWRGDDTAGRRVATGTYFYVIEAGDFHQVRKMTLVK